MTQMDKIVSNLNHLFATHGVTCEFVPADDESVDSEIMFYVDQRAEAVAGIQISGRHCCPNVWTQTMDAIEFGKEYKLREIDLVAGALANLMAKYGWIK
jgi:hypothetical protein